jgi:murein DD-endopeptidase MepM/ murein hydrolase activator NlpD
MHRDISTMVSLAAALALATAGALLWQADAAGAVERALDRRAVAADPPSPKRPVAVAPVAGEVTRAFEQPQDAYGPGHRGVDLAVTRAEPVRSAMAGTVRFAGSVAGETWVTVMHADGIETTYGGIAPSVTAGERVAIGQHLGRMRPGRRVLDWGVRLGRTYIDPLGLLAGWRVRLVTPTGR